LQFNNATITEIAFPACDAASTREPTYLTVKLAPEFTRPTAGSGAVMKKAPSKNQKRWLPSNFVLKVQGLEAACARVNKIEALAIRQSMAQSQVGEMRDYQKEPGKLEFPNLVITLPESDAGPFYAWFVDMVLKGNAGEDRERPGVLDLLTPDRQQVLLSLSFSHLGIFGFTPEKAVANADLIKRVKVEMYCEQIALQPGAGAVASAGEPG
jgi:hypothetical protein